jgi:hypothetical protein
MWKVSILSIEAWGFRQMYLPNLPNVYDSVSILSIEAWGFRPHGTPALWSARIKFQSSQ